MLNIYSSVLWTLLLRADEYLLHPYTPVTSFYRKIRLWPAWILFYLFTVRHSVFPFAVLLFAGYMIWGFWAPWYILGIYDENGIRITLNIFRSRISCSYFICWEFKDFFSVQKCTEVQQNFVSYEWRTHFSRLSRKIE